MIGINSLTILNDWKCSKYSIDLIRMENVMRKDILRISGFVLYIVVSSIDKFVIKIPSGLYIALGVLAISLVVAGLCKEKRQGKN